MFEIYLTKDEVDELLGLVRHRSILHNVLSMEWGNDFDEDEELECWRAEKQHFQLLLQTLQVIFPQLYPIL
jgi:hypothetical protein